MRAFEALHVLLLYENIPFTSVSPLKTLCAFFLSRRYKFRNFWIGWSPHHTHELQAYKWPIQCSFMNDNLIIVQLDDYRSTGSCRVRKRGHSSIDAHLVKQGKLERLRVVTKGVVWEGAGVGVANPWLFDCPPLAFRTTHPCYQTFPLGNS